MSNVTLREKKLKRGRISLYLDFYPPIPDGKGGATRREFLNLYILAKPTSVIDKSTNRETLAIAQAVRAKRQLDIQNKRFGFISKKSQGTNLVQYYKELADKRKSSNYDNWISSLHFFEEFTGGELKAEDLSEKFCNDYKEFLQNTKSKKSDSKRLAQNSAVSYFNKFKAVLKHAYKDGLIDIDLNARISRIKEKETHREYLSVEELKKLSTTEFDKTILKNAALFSALTGLRFSDIEKLTWGEIRVNQVWDEQSEAFENSYYIQYTQQKTGNTEVLPIAEEAFHLAGERKDENSKVFEGLIYSAYNNSLIKKWVLKAGITKNITFHCFRHTYAVLQLASGTDMSTISKMLGHRDLKTTQVYAKVIDSNKIAATKKIKLKMSE